MWFSSCIKTLKIKFKKKKADKTTTQNNSNQNNLIKDGVLILQQVVKEIANFEVLGKK